jgi:hypothetical protein
MATHDLYLDLMKKCILGLIVEDRAIATVRGLRFRNFRYFPQRFNRELRERGEDWPSRAHSMIGLPRMNNIQHCVESVIADGVPGDLIETGVWRGGATIFMRAVLKAHAVDDRTVWAADSFAGLPPPNAKKYPADRGLYFSLFSALAVSLDEVKANFERYGLLDEQVRFLKGWFRDTLPGAPIDKLAVLRMDGDLYESTMDALTNLYPKLSVGGYVIVDDFHIRACAKAVNDYREAQRIRDEIRWIDAGAAYWRRSGT